MPAAAVANTARAGTVTQGVAKTLASQPVVQLAGGAAGGATSGATDNPLLGAAVGLATPLAAAGVRGAISPTTNRLTDAEKRLVEVAAREGVPLTPAQQTGSPTLRTLEETMAKLPLSSGPMGKTYKDQRQSLARAITERAGTVADDASPETLTKMGQTLGSQFDDLAARTTLKPDQRFAADVTKAEADYGRRLPTDVAPVFKSYIDDLQPVMTAIGKGESPEIAGETYKTIRSDITKRMKNTSNADLKEALGGLRTALDGVVDRSSSGSLLKEWQEVRKQYSAYKTIDKAMQGGKQGERAAAEIPLGAFSNAVRGSDKEGFARARGQYGELSKLADFLAPQIPDSGTVGRGATANILSGGALLTAGTAGADLGTGAALAATPWAASKLYNSPLAKAYLTNQAAGTTDLKALYGAEALRQMIGESRGEPSALARALMRANEQKAAR
jgi:hypothetical protein